MQEQHFNKLIKFSKKVRMLALEMVYKAKASHIGGAFSIVDILSVLYNGFLKINPQNPNESLRDRFLLSKGHACVSLYATLSLRGYFEKSILKTYGEDGSILMSHVSSEVPGVEFSTGSLGHALPVGEGIALARKRKKENWKTVVLMSDGELDEGSNWEAFLMAPHLKLGNLYVIIDYNKIQSLGNTNEVINLEPLEDKFKSFNWEIGRVNGHNHKEIYNALISLEKTDTIKPKLLIADTIKGKGVSFMENKLLWHYHSPSEQEYKQAIKELDNA